MLVNNNSKYVNLVVTFKLVNGDEIISKVISEDEKQYMLSKPTLMIPSQNGIRLIQALMSADPDNDFPLDKCHVMLHGLTIDQLADHYRETTTGLQTVRKSSIIT